MTRSAKELVVAKLILLYLHERKEMDPYPAQGAPLASLLADVYLHMGIVDKALDTLKEAKLVEAAWVHTRLDGDGQKVSHHHLKLTDTGKTFVEAHKQEFNMLRLNVYKDIRL